VALLTPIATSARAQPQGADHSLSKRDVANSLTRRLAKRDFVTLEKPRCKPRGTGALYACTWRAEGHPAGKVPFECEGKAKLQVSRDRWRIKGCNEKLITLLPDLGAHPQFGYNEDWYARGGLEMAASGGAVIGRQSVFWSSLEGTRDDYHWFPYDRLYQRMLANGIRPLWVLASPPCWAQAPQPPQLLAPCSYQPGPPTAEHFSDLGELAALLAQRYPESVGIEVWNEPNYRLHWGADPDPSAYGEMTKEVANAVHAANPSMPVISAGLAPLSNDGPEGMAYDSFLRQAYETGGPQLTDAIGAHPYPLSNYKQDYLSPIRASLYRYMAVMSDFGDASTPIWVTETGVSIYEDKRGFAPDEQAIALVEIYTQFRRIANLPMVIFHRLRDDPLPGGKEAGYGVLDGDGNPKPAYCAVAAAREQPC
jgi:hypothetical protein